MALPRNDNIGLTLKYYRKIRGLSVAEVCDYLNKTYGLGISQKTVYGWESNQAHPTADMLIAMCEYYGIKDITCMSARPYRETIILSEEEEAMILAYRKAVRYQPAINALLNPLKPNPWPRLYQYDDTSDNS